MSESCVIDGKRCTMCCRAITLKPIPDSNTGYDAEFVRQHWVKISEEEARAVNPWMFTIGRDYAGAGYGFYRCSLVTDDGCSAYDRRPDVCSGYPRYGLSEEAWRHVSMDPDFTARCTEFPVVIPVVNL